MFGLLYALFVGGVAFKESVEQNYYKTSNRINAVKKGNKTYYDAQGGLYYVQPNNQDIPCYKIIDSNNHEVLMSLNDGIVLEDYTQAYFNNMDKIFKIEAKRAKEEAIKNGKIYYEVKYVKGLRFPNICHVFIDGYLKDYSSHYDKRLKYRYLVSDDTAYEITKPKYDSTDSYYSLVVYDVDKFKSTQKDFHLIDKDFCKKLGGWMRRV